MGSRLARHFRFIELASHRLARSIFHAMVVHRAGLEKRQRVLARFVDIGVDLFAMAAACAHARTLADAARGTDGAAEAPVELADIFSKMARRRIEANFRAVRSNDDRAGYRVARDLLEGRYTWLEKGVLQP